MTIEGIGIKECDLLEELDKSIEAVCGALVQRMQIVAHSNEKLEEITYLCGYLRIAQLELLKYMYRI